jgi:hypothetical protein
MGDYRDGDQAARERARVLEEELAESEAEAEAQRAEIERQAEALRAKDAELAVLRARVSAPVAPSTGTRVCERCGCHNAAQNAACVSCGQALSGLPVFPAPPSPAPQPAPAKRNPWVAFIVMGTLLFGVFVVLATMMVGWFFAVAR